MNARTKVALLGSIAKWEGIVAGTVEDSGPKNCPLCRAFNQTYIYGLRGDNYDGEEPGACTGCPVFEKTGEDFCSGSPYEEYEDIDPDAENAEERMKELAQAELEFLRSLLPAEPAT